MKILVTGSTGFIGSHLLVELLRKEHEVVAVRRPGSEPVIQLERQPIWLERSFLNLDAQDFEGVEVVVHLAAAGVSPQRACWQELEQINVTSGLRLIQLAHKSGVLRFVSTGSCIEYGAEALNWVNIPPWASLRPATPYGASKAAGFLTLHAYAMMNSIEFFYGRIFTAYGKGQFRGNLWPSLRSAAQAGVDFPMTKGEQIRDFIPVSKVAQHLRIAVERSDLQMSKPLVVNIGTGKGQSVVDFAREQWKKFGAPGRLKPGDLSTRTCETPRLVADITLLEPHNKKLSK